jgi:hypothetical protein
MEGQAAAEGGPLYALPLVLQQVDSLELPVPDIDDDERARAVAFLAHGSFLARAAPVVLPALVRSHPRFGFLLQSSGGAAAARAPSSLSSPPSTPSLQVLQQDRS